MYEILVKEVCALKKTQFININMASSFKFECSIQKKSTTERNTKKLCRGIASLFLLVLPRSKQDQERRYHITILVKPHLNDCAPLNDD